MAQNNQNNRDNQDQRNQHDSQNQNDSGGRGFASMDEEKHKDISSKGGQSHRQDSSSSQS